MESSNSNSKERELQLTQRLAKQRHSHCMAWFEQLETHLRDLYLNSSSHVVDAFKPTFHSFFGEEHQTFRVKMFHNLDQLRLQLERENLLEINPRTCLEAFRTQFKEFFASKRSLVTESTTLEVNLSIDVNALDVGLAVTESNGTNSYKQDTSSTSGNHITHVADGDIRPVKDSATIVSSTISITIGIVEVVSYLSHDVRDDVLKLLSNDFRDIRRVVRLSCLNHVSAKT
ncbi:hypothetical protein Tco_0054392 [Tanacetum coccineum]